MNVPGVPVRTATGWLLLAATFTVCAIVFLLYVTVTGNDVGLVKRISGEGSF